MKSITFNVQANDLHSYPVTIKFEDKLPSMILVGFGGRMGKEFREHAFGIKEVMPRKRMTITIDDSKCDMYALDDHGAPEGQYTALRASGASIAAQVYAALQMAT